LTAKAVITVFSVKLFGHWIIWCGYFFVKSVFYDVLLVKNSISQ